jgi:RHH-type proline utilization regulon transcriptional repressor/proline dehydrogenase/delta 1-pyrroline-5-carboxylate dehydrogenase
MRIRVHPDDTEFEVYARVAAAAAAGSRITVSYPHDGLTTMLRALARETELWGAQIEFVEESDGELAEVIARQQTDRIRYAAPDRVPEVVLRAVGETGVYIASAPVRAEGRVELPWYFREQSISFDYHRYGTLGDRADEERRPTL